MTEAAETLKNESVNDVDVNIADYNENIDTTASDEDVKDAKSVGIDVNEFERTRKALAKANKEAADRRHKLQEWERLGVDPATVETMLQQQREAEIKKAEEEGRYQELLDKMRNDTQSKIKAAEDKVANMQQSLERQLKGKAVVEAIAAEGGIVPLLESHVAKHVRVVEKDGDYIQQVVDADGQIMLDAKGNPMTLRGLVKAFKQDPDLSHGFKAPKTSGMNTSSNETASKGGKVQFSGVRRSKMSNNESRDFVKKHGYDAYSELPW